MTAPRIAPLDPEHLAPKVRELLDALPDTALRTANITTTLARHPELLAASFPLSTMLLYAGTLPDRDRELVILRTAHLAGSAYIHAQHVRIGHLAGLTPAEIARTAAGPGADDWSAHEAALLTAADELHHHACISEATWQRLAQHYGEQQLIEVSVLAGHYRMWAAALNSFGVTPDPAPPTAEREVSDATG
ncbi:carboxymuconolactone decarboxylase family protein [Streptomyces sp. 769]|uniref:carboxymuconolactone decarboxylase family protein n=1 Tax=Streptomyces sp. 769 TaxID=1262452 RepID=UPI0007C6C455|nr:carboxymuconolactone decarboxylase family protein [Streptomyces sp. 769]